MSEHLSPEEADTLTRVLDEIVPPSADGRLPGAGEIGLAAHIEAQMEATPDLRPAITAGLAALTREAAERGAESFAALGAEDARAVLNAVAASEPAFLPGLIFQTYVGYYQQPRVLEGLGIEGRPPFPEGYTMEPADLDLLAPVRKRPPMY